MATDTKAKKLTAIREPFTKAQLFAAISDDTGLTKRDVAAVFDSLSQQMSRHLKKRGAGTFTLPGLAKFVVQNKKATKARKGINPFTREPTVFAAKPARRIVKIRPLKAIKEMADS
jgi:nucleoid DNA-binding protein